MPRSCQETPELTNTENSRTTSYLYILFLLLTAANPGVNTIAYEVYITYDILCGTASIINLMISLERFISVMEHAIHRNLSRKTISLTISAVWIYIRPPFGKSCYLVIVRNAQLTSTLFKSVFVKDRKLPFSCQAQ